MIQPKELRLGNLVKTAYDDSGLPGVCKILELQRSKVSVIFDDKYPEESNYLSLLPIPLTEEWLLRFGFSQLVSGKALTDEFEKDSLILAMPTNEGAGFQVCIEKKYINLNIVWVHQLQNLYFALTGEELTIE